MGMKTKGYLACVSVAVALGTFLAVTAPAAAADSASEPAQPGQRIVMLIPGQQPSPGTSSLDQFDDMAAQLAGEGYVVHPVGVNGLDLIADSSEIADAVDRATAGVEVESLAIVAHSYGGLSSRSYLKTLGGSDIVDTYIAIGTPQYGSPGGCVQLPGFGFDGCPITPFIADLNAGDDTPGDTGYVSIRSDEELADGRLDGGQCRLAPIKDLVHAVEPADARVIDAVSGALSGECAGEFVDEADGAITLDKTLFPAPTTG